MDAQYGLRIRAVRKSLGLTQELFAQKCGISLTSLRRYEANDRQPNISTIESMANSLDMTLAEFLWSTTTPGAVPAKQLLLTAFDQLNEKGQSVAVERVEELGKVPEYKK